MSKVAIIRCAANESTCPMTNCLKCLFERREGFSVYNDAQLMGLFTCRCPGDTTVELATILKQRGADALHFCTCTFARKSAGGWDLSEGGFCDHIDDLIDRIHTEVNIRCVKGTAHLPKGYDLQIWD